MTTTLLSNLFANFTPEELAAAEVQEAELKANVLGTRTLLGAPGIATSNKKLLESIKKSN